MLLFEADFTYKGEQVSRKIKSGIPDLTDALFSYLSTYTVSSIKDQTEILQNTTINGVPAIDFMRFYEGNRKDYGKVSIPEKTGPKEKE